MRQGFDLSRNCQMRNLFLDLFLYRAGKMCSILHTDGEE